VIVAVRPKERALVGTDQTAKLGRLALTPVATTERIPLSRACGRYVDWYVVR